MTPTSSASPSLAAGRVPLGLKAAYGFGSVAFAVKDTGFNYFILLFYSQVMGVDARLVGVAITTALVFDALSDPVVGYWSDNLRSRWGRRHPFMYAAALPVSLSYFFLWSPPADWSQFGLFVWILVLALIIRTFITAYETPSTALVPELSSDYDERSALLSFRYLFGWSTGAALLLTMFVGVFPAMVTETHADGRFNPESYAVFGLVSSGLMLLSILLSAGATHRRAAAFVPPPQRRLTLRRVFAEIIETLSERSFIALFAAALFASVAGGLGTGMTFYFATYYWEFSSQQTGLIGLGVFASAIIGFVLAPRITRRLGKKRGAILIGLVAFLGAPVPIALRLFGLMPENGSPWLFPIVFSAITIDTGLIICYQILASSMMADLVEQSELKTRRRSEGVFFSSLTFIRKAVQGIGLLVASFVLYFAGVQAGATVGEVSDAALWRMGALYVPLYVGLYLLTIVAVSTYRLERADHEENLRQLDARRSAEPEPD